MSRDWIPDTASGEVLVEKERVYRIVGCAMEVINEVGHGYREKAYERSLVIALRDAGMSTASQQKFPVMFRGEKVDEYIPDLIVDERVVVDPKVVDAFNDEHTGQILNYLRVTGLQVGLLLNFKRPKLQWKRIVLQEDRNTVREDEGEYEC